MSTVVPFGVVLRIWAGAVFNGNEFSATGRVIDGRTDTSDGVPHEAGAGDSVGADVDFNSVAAYLGIGWSSASSNSGFSLTADLGVMC